MGLVLSRFMQWWERVKRLYMMLLPLRFSFIALAAVAFAFLASAQGYDIIAHIAEDDPTGTNDTHTEQRAAYIVAVILFALQIWYWSRQLLHLKVSDEQPDPDEFPRLTAWLPRLLGISSFVVAIGALYRVFRHYDVPEPIRVARFMALELALALVLFILFVIARRRWMKNEMTDQYTWQTMPRITRMMLAVSSLIALTFFLVATFAVQSTVHLGSATMVLVGCALAIPFGSALVVLGMRAGAPILTILLIWAVIISPFADNHVIKRVPASSALVDARPNVAQAFDAWFTRLKRDYPGRESYPVFIVATEGGGIRAAYWTGAVLTALNDDVPAFGDHLFAISGVSGGSLGTAVYTALRAKQLGSGYVVREQNLDANISDAEMVRMRTAAKHILSQDPLTPTLASMLTSDLAQRFIPAPVLPDRERALEGGWERAWQHAISTANKPDQTFAGGLLSMMNGRADRLPSIFLNGTLVETGQRIVASNCRIDPAEIVDSIDLYRNIGSDLAVSTSAANSTRFTFVSPAGTLTRSSSDNGGSPVSCAPGDPCEHVVDGGYFENSGAATASDVLDVIRLHPDAARLRPHVIFISFRMAEPPPLKPTRVANEVLSPVRALLSTRGSRGTLAVAELKQSVGPNNHTTFELVQSKTVFPLGWLLADRTRNLMDAQMGPAAGENGTKMRHIAALLRRPIIEDPVHDRAMKGEAAPTFID